MQTEVIDFSVPRWISPYDKLGISASFPDWVVVKGVTDSIREEWREMERSR